MTKNAKSKNVTTVAATESTAAADPANEFRYGERGVIYRGDTFRAKGGPTYKGARVGEPGLYRLIRVHRTKRGRVYLEAVPVDRHSIQKGGTHTLYVEGKPYRLAGLENWLCRPYRVAKVRV